MTRTNEREPTRGHAAFSDAMDGVPIEDLCVNTIRTLSMDAIQQANSGHPGAPMALAPVAYVLWKRIMRHNPANPAWFNRDRFVLSCGHASMLLYSVLHLAGYGISIEDIVRFRQGGSKTPGHPEYDPALGVETTTGPLGQGLMNAVGMAMAEAHLAAGFNRPGHKIVDHHTYVLCSDGDMMEGASHEAASVAGHLRLGKMVWVYDANRITIDGEIGLAFSEDVKKRFEGYRWYVQDLGEQANDLEGLTAALEVAKGVEDRPSLVIMRSHLAFGSPNFQDSEKAHGSPLGEEEVRLTKRAYRWPEGEKFLVPEGVLGHMRELADRGLDLEARWRKDFEAYREAYPELASQFEVSLKDDPPPGWEEEIPSFKPEDGPMATRSASGKVLNAISNRIPWLVGGSADLSESTNSLLRGSGNFSWDQPAHRNIRWGVREHLMCAAASGMALHGGVRPYAATFLVFADYARPAMRLAAMMGLAVVYVMTHDSIGLGEDGPTHQPVEQLASLRAIPNMCVIRPADANEAAYAWRAAIERKSGPTVLVLTRQAVPVFDRDRTADAAGLLRGAYVLSGERGGVPGLILIGTGSEVSLLLAAQEQLFSRGVDVRVVSMPSWELFRAQPREYRDEVFPPGVKARLAVEAAAPQGWAEWVGENGEVLGISRFGESAPAGENFQKFGFTVERVVERAEKLLGN